MATLYLIRHAEPAITGVFLGQLDPPLSPAGKVQAAAAMAHVSVEIAWISPLLRARETAAFVHSPRVTELAELREIDMGAWTGKTWSEIEANWSDLAFQKRSDWLATPAPGGENWSVFLDRVSTAWNKIRIGPTPAAVIGHLGVNAALAHLIDGRAPLSFAQSYGEVVQLAYDQADHR